MGLYLKKKLENEATIGVWQITESEEELVKLAATPTDEMEEISFIRSESLAVILHDEEDCGIDVESLDRDFSAVEKKALSEEEIDDLEDDKRNEQLAIYWCAKEAIFKLLSRYNVDFAEQIEIERFRPRGEGELEATFVDKDGDEEEFDLEYMTFDRHVLVWVVGD